MIAIFIMILDIVMYICHLSFSKQVELTKHCSHNEQQKTNLPKSTYPICNTCIYLLVSFLFVYVFLKILSSWYQHSTLRVVRYCVRRSTLTVVRESETVSDFSISWPGSPLDFLIFRASPEIFKHRFAFCPQHRACRLSDRFTFYQNLVDWYK